MAYLPVREEPNGTLWVQEPDGVWELVGSDQGQDAFLTDLNGQGVILSTSIPVPVNPGSLGGYDNQSGQGASNNCMTIPCILSHLRTTLLNLICVKCIEGQLVAFLTQTLF